MKSSQIINLILFLAIVLLSCDTPDQGETFSSGSGAVVEGDSVQPFISYDSAAVVGETVYVPVYSHIYQQNQTRTFNLTATLSIRNTDLQNTISIKKVYYYDSDGNLVHRYLDEQKKLKPLSSTSYVIEEEDLRGGVGANYLVLWEAQQMVNKPVIEAVMISTAQNQGISFVSEGRVIHTFNSTSQ